MKNKSNKSCCSQLMAYAGFIVEDSNLYTVYANHNDKSQTATFTQTGASNTFLT